MKYLIVIFSVRNDTLRFYNIIKKYNIFGSIVNTPHALSRSCGISVRIPYGQLELCKQLIARNSFATFKGIYEINMSNLKDIPTRIY